MARIKVKDLSRDQKIGREELKRLSGGYGGYFYEGPRGKMEDIDYKATWDLLSFSPGSINYLKDMSHKVYAKKVWC